MRLMRPRQWGACWLAGQLWRDLHLDQFWSQRLARSRKGTRWEQVLQVLVAYRLISPGSEWQLHRDWFGKSAMADLLSADFGLADMFGVSWRKTLDGPIPNSYLRVEESGRKHPVMRGFEDAQLLRDGRSAVTTEGSTGTSGSTTTSEYSSDDRLMRFPSFARAAAEKPRTFRLVSRRKRLRK
jgi:hypothetical protein